MSAAVVVAHPVVNNFGNGDRSVFPKRDALCLAALALADDRNVSVADGRLGFLVHLTLQCVP
jgi:hypothetical protein